MKKNTMNITRSLCSILAAILCCASCSFNSPSIALPKIQRLYKHTVKESFVENLAVFAAFEDSDGINDYKELVLQENATGLEWRLHRGNTIFLKEAAIGQQAQWVGSNTFTYPRGNFPAGAYTLTLSDLGGNINTYSFTLQEPPTVNTIPFQFMLNKSQWQIDIHDPAFCRFFSLILLDTNMQPIQVYPLTRDETQEITGNIQDIIAISSDIRYVQCFSENDDQSIGFFSTPILLP